MAKRATKSSTKSAAVDSRNSEPPRTWDEPPHPAAEKKVWGWVRHRLLTYAVELDELWIHGGGFSSLHMHFAKTNLFIVERGLLCVELFGETPTVANLAWDNEREWECPSSVRYLETGDSLAVPALVWHRFVAVKDTICSEVYWSTGPAAVRPGDKDINRHTTNGLRPARDLPETAFRQMFSV